MRLIGHSAVLVAKYSGPEHALTLLSPLLNAPDWRGDNHAAYSLITWLDNRHEEAITCLVDWLSDHPDWVSCRLALARFHIVEGDFEKAKFHIALALRNDVPGAMNLDYYIVGILRSVKDARVRLEILPDQCANGLIRDCVLALRLETEVELGIRAREDVPPRMRRRLAELAMRDLERTITEE
jgi:hypothetical protein